MSEKSYSQQAMEDARQMLLEYIDQVAEQARDGEVSDDLYNDYADGDEYHHQQHVDRDYSLTEAARILDELSDSEETDSGLWHGLEPRRAIAAQAAYTYGNAVMSRWQALIAEVNEVLEIDDACEDCREGYARLFITLECEWEDDRIQAGNYAQAAIADLKRCDLTSALIFCDWLAVNGQERKSKELRDFVTLCQSVEEEEPVEE